MLGEPVRGGFPDPAIYALPGIEQLRAFLSGLAPQPPLVRLTGATLTQVGSGTVSVSMPASPWLMQLEALEITMLAVRTLLSPESGGVIARGRVIHTGRGVTVSEVLVEDGTGRGVAHGTGSVITEPMKDPPPARPLRPVEEPRYSTPDPYLRPAPGPITGELIDQATGLELFQRIVDGALVVPVELIGIRCLDAGEGQFCLALPTSDWLCLERGRVASAAVMAVASVSLHSATLTVASRGQRLAAIHQAVEFLRPVQADGREIVPAAK